MAKQRYINTHFWDDSYIVELDPIEKLLFLYAITNPLTSIVGAYEISLRRITFDTGIDREKILQIFAKFEADNKMFFRDGWLFVENFIKNQSLNPKIVKGIEISLRDCPQWIIDKASKTMDSLSKASIYSNSNSNSNRDSNSNSPADSVSPPAESPNAEFDAKRDEILTAVKKVYNSSVLAKEDRWVDAIENAITADIPTDAFTEELKQLLADTSRKYPITPENVLTAAIEKRARTTTLPTSPPKKAKTIEEILNPPGFPKMKVAVTENLIKRGYNAQN